MEKTKVILSTNGPLHLIKSAEFLAPLVDINVIQGWIPRWYDKFLLKVASKIIGRDLSKSLKKRTPEILKGRNKSVALPEFYLWFCRYFIPGIPNHNLRTAKMYGFLSKRFIKNADIFHVRSGSGGGGAIEKAKKKGMKVVVDHSAAHPVFANWQLKEDYNRNGLRLGLGINVPLWRKILADCEKADILLVNSNFVKNTFAENGYAKKIEVAYLGVRRDFFSLKQKYATSQTIKILFTGSFKVLKGGEYILKAMQELDKKQLPYEMIFVGNYSNSGNLLEAYKSKNCRFVGQILQDELKHYLSESDIYLFPSLCEGCASSGMEAMAAGLPVIATKESGLPIIDEENGLIIPSKNVDAIVDAVIKLYEDKQLREKIGIAAAKTISENYTWEQYADKVVDIYRGLLPK